MNLTQEERDQLIAMLSPQQQEFIHVHVKRGKRTVFVRELAKSKGYVITNSMSEEEVERFVDEWYFEDFIDVGPNYRQTKPYKCECGIPLRYVYIVRHNETGKRYIFGKDHFQQHTGIPASIVKAIIDGMNVIDYERDEILLKIKQGWTFDEEFPYLPDGFVIREEFQKPLDLGLPLLDRQIDRLRFDLRRFLEEQQALETRAVEEEPEVDVNVFGDDEKEPTENEPTGEHFQFELFPVSPKKKSENIIEDTDQLLPEVKHWIHRYLEQGIQSVRALCELLITEHQLNRERYSTGKPRIYPAVCLYLDYLVDSGKAEFLGEAAGKEDRRYRLVP